MFTRSVCPLTNCPSLCTVRDVIHGHTTHTAQLKGVSFVRALRSAQRHSQRTQLRTHTSFMRRAIGTMTRHPSLPGSILQKTTLHHALGHPSQFPILIPFGPIAQLMVAQERRGSQIFFLSLQQKMYKYMYKDRSTPSRTSRTSTQQHPSKMS